MNCLDTYALCEISKANPSYAGLLQKDFVIAELTLIEFYWVLLREHGIQTADYWLKKLQAYTKPTSQEIQILAMKYRYEHKKENLSFFDCVGYMFAIANNFVFVTGDKEFEKKSGVLFIK